MPDALSPPAASLTLPALPFPWVAVLTESGAVYYHNEETDATQWRLPSPTRSVAAVAAAVAPPATPPAGLPAAVDEGGEALPPLPDGWFEATSQAGRTYYWHEETERTQWTRPLQ